MSDVSPVSQPAGVPTEGSRSPVDSSATVFGGTSVPPSDQAMTEVSTLPTEANANSATSKFVYI